MLDLMNTWDGKIEIDNIIYDNLASAKAQFKGSLIGKHIKLYTNSKKPVNEHPTTSQTRLGENTIYKIKVRQYMTKKSSPEFDFMAKWNNDNPMPLRVMVGTKIKETAGMVYMKLNGDIVADVTPTCMKCGKKITNKVSQFFGMGPECGEHNYINPFDSDEELQNAVAQYKLKLQAMTWEGWIIKSAIESEVVINEY